MEIWIERLYRGFLIVEQSDEPIQIKKYGTENAEQTIKTIKSILGIPEPSPSWLDLNQEICMPDEPDPTPSPGETPGQGQKTQPPVPNILKQDILIRRFEYDHSLRKSIPDYKNTWYAELQDGRVVLGYGKSSYYTTKENIMKIPYPVPYGYFKGSGVSTTAMTCLRAYRQTFAKSLTKNEDDGFSPGFSQKADCKCQTEMSEKTKKLREMTIKMGIQ